jgi:ABC-type oligopeptide transport system ATPase subunit
MSVLELLTEGMQIHRIGAGATDRRRRAAELLDRVRLPSGTLDRYPHEFSGGQRQRIAIARALSVGPEFIICDEPTSALDVSVQSQVLNLLADLQQESGLTYLFITHNLAVVEHLADAVAVMEDGKIVEHGSVEQIFDRSTHPYTRRLIGALPSLDPSQRKIGAQLDLDGNGAPPVPVRGGPVAAPVEGVRHPAADPVGTPLPAGDETASGTAEPSA